MKCPICNTDDESKFIKDWHEYKLYSCKLCKVMFSRPMKGPGQAYYEESEMHLIWEYGSDRIEWQHKEFLKENKLGKTLLDIGCGAGLFLKEANSRGYKVTGIDFAGKNIEIVKKRLNIEDAFAMDLQTFISNFSGRRYAVVTFFEVLEHLENPLEFILDVKKVLKPEGYIVFSVPNYERFLDPYGKEDNPPNHLTKWNLISIRNFMEANGFKIIKLITKRITIEDVSNHLKVKIRFGIVRKMVMKQNSNRRRIKKIFGLMKIKNLLFSIISFPVYIILKLFSPKGVSIFCVARME